MKKIVTLALILSSGMTAAGTMGPASTPEMSKFYIEGAAGWTSSDWLPAINYVFPAQLSSQYTNLNGGFTAGGDVGYIINRYFSIEVGALSLPSVSYNIQSGTSTYQAQDSGTISNWLIDFSGKATLPVAPISGLDLFAKFGAVYRAGKYTDQEVLNGEANIFVQPSVFNIIGPILGGGLQYHINEHWVVNAQYLFTPYGVLSTTILGPTEEDHGSIPSAQIVTGGIGFYF